MSGKYSTKVKFEAVAQEIQTRIQKGLYVSSQKLPSEYDLAKEFEVSRLTIRKAIDDLVQKNVLYKLKGKGSYVMSQQKIQSGRSGLQGFTEAAKEYGKVSKTQVISFKLLKERPKVILEALHLTEEAEIYELVRRRLYDEVPMTVEKIYLTKEYVEAYTEKDFEGSLFKLLEEKVEIAYSHQEVEAILVTKELAKLLEVPVGNPLLQVHSITYTKDAAPILYDQSYYRADKYTFKNTLIRN
ncbi:MAG: GntR family transcriptional regulator [Enterococcus sp.]|nr:GntR family transcriptional regulator [Enterococcus sp.]